MEQMVFTALSREEFHAIVIDAVNACLRRHAAQQYATPDNVPGEAGTAFVNKRQAAAILSCSVSSIENFARLGKIKRYKPFGSKFVRFDRAQILSLAKSH